VGDQGRDFINAVLALWTPEPAAPTRNAFRLEDWNDWPERWRAAYETVHRMMTITSATPDAVEAGAIPQRRIAFGPGKRFGHAVVGESRYLSTLQRVAGDRLAAGETVVVSCLVVAEPENRYDPNAIAVYIAGAGKVGYFSRDDATRWGKVAAMLTISGAAGVCEGFLRGGSGEKTNIGVWLSLRGPDELLADWDRLIE